jgi:flagellar motility protein MotE (MotC chaperone)
MTATMAGAAAVANVVAAASPAPQGKTRLGVAIERSMRDRDQALDKRNRALDLREQAARAAEQRLHNDVKAEAEEAAAASPGSAGVKTQQDAVFGNLARIYQTMRPNKAAPIFENLALDVQVQVAKRMRERQIALIMSQMSPEAAVDLSMALAGRKVETAPPPRASAAKPRAERPDAAEEAREAVPRPAPSKPAPKSSDTARPAVAARPRKTRVAKPQTKKARVAPSQSDAETASDTADRTATKHQTIDMAAAEHLIDTLLTQTGGTQLADR